MIYANERRKDAADANRLKPGISTAPKRFTFAHIIRVRVFGQAYPPPYN